MLREIFSLSKIPKHLDQTIQTRCSLGLAAQPLIVTKDLHRNSASIFKNPKSSCERHENNEDRESLSHP